MWYELSYPWQVAVSEAWAAFRAGTIPIGAAIVDGGGRVIASGRNRLYEPRMGSTQHIAGVKLAHAEINALMAMVPAGNPRDFTIYTTTEPCPMCAGAILMCNLRSVAYASRDPWAGSTNMYEATDYMRSKHMRVHGPLPQLETVLYALQTEFMLREAVVRGAGLRSMGERAAAPNAVIQAMMAADLAGVALGERLYESGELGKLSERGAPAGEVIDWLEGLIVRM